jgi:carbonic anhydrase
VPTAPANPIPAPPAKAPAEADAGAAHAPGAHAGPPHWAYEGEGGPEHWGDLSSDFAACKTGTKQTPIDLSTKSEKGKDLKPLAFAYAPIPLQILNNGHTVQVANTSTSSLTNAAGKWNLAQFHMHASSEHTVDGKSFDMELHLVHKNDKGELLVVGVFLKKGKENKALAAVFDNAPSEVSKEPKAISGAKIDLASLLPAKAAYYTYTGSLTTPPCSEGVNWFVLAAPAEVSDAQIAKFKAVTHGPTNRPVQPAQGRTVVQFKP